MSDLRPGNARILLRPDNSVGGWRLPDGREQGLEGTIYDVCPNLVFTDSTTTGIGTTLTQAVAARIPGGVMDITSRLEIAAIVDLAGNDSKDIQMRIGPATGTFSAASQFSGQLGLTTQKYVGLAAMLWNDNSLSAQRACPIGQNNWVGTNASNPTATFAVDTALDWVIYLGVKCNVANGAPTNSLTVRNFAVKMYHR